MSTNLKAKCSNCNTQLTIKQELLGKQIKCPKCQTKLVIGKPSVSRAAGPAVDRQPEQTKIKCQCGTILTVPPSVRGKNIRCPQCQLVLKAPGQSTQTAGPVGKKDTSDVGWNSLPSIPTQGHGGSASSFPAASPGPGANPYAKPPTAKKTKKAAKSRKTKSHKATLPQRDWSEVVSRRIHMIMFLMVIISPFLMLILGNRFWNQKMLEERGKAVVGVVANAQEIRKRRQMTGYRLTVRFTTEEDEIVTDKFPVNSGCLLYTSDAADE